MKVALAKKNIVMLAASSSLAALPAQAALLEDSKVKFSANNIYFNRDFREGSGQNKREEWGQAFALEMRSGFTEGTVGFGLDANAALGLKLDSGGGRTGTGLLPRHDDGHSADEFSRLQATAKAKVSATELRFGSHVPKLPVVSSSTSRLLPQVFAGTTLQSAEVDGLALTAARFSKVIDRASTNAEKLTLAGNGGRYRGGVESKHLSLFGADWKVTQDITARYWQSELKDVYQQQFVGLTASHKLPAGTVSADVRFFRSKDSGQSLAGKVDNHAFSSLFSYKLGAQKVGLGWQQMDGKTGFAHIGGGDPYLVNFVQIGNFGEAGERSWQGRYDFDFKDLMPGLSFMARYLQGRSAHIPGRSGAYAERERDLELQYQVQQGRFKGLSLRLRNAQYRSEFSRDADETRLIISYSLSLL
ncbi:porin [Ventosimonas gracilis]|uniref:Porin n=1 Tax=Ventosimonas gracilis TaxID=1680762 RepID=A0A139SJ45_9GAMM|nr:OprD family porin [Ventosimonas gracilis]KXU34595.1 porin [Ventosimonas gracilis]